MYQGWMNIKGRNYFLSYSIDSFHEERKGMLNINMQLFIYALRGVICYALNIW